MSREEWLRMRYMGIGGSDVGVILGLNKWFSKIHLFYQKLGMYPFKDENQEMFWGNELENHIADKWQYWDGEASGMIKNFRNQNPIRKCRRLNYIVQNPKYPIFWANLDRGVYNAKTLYSIIDDSSDIEPFFPLECKTISGFYSKQWKAGIPPEYYTQIQTYMLVTEADYSEFAILKDGRYIDVFPIKKNDQIQQTIITECQEFWDNIIEARKYSTKYHLCIQKAGEMAKQGNRDQAEHFSDKAEKYRQMVERHEPFPDGSDAYTEFLDEKYKESEAGLTIMGNANIAGMARKSQEIKQEINNLESDRNLIIQSIQKYMKDAEKIDMGAIGSITWKPDKNGKRRMRINLN